MKLSRCRIDVVRINCDYIAALNSHTGRLGRGYKDIVDVSRAEVLGAAKEARADAKTRTGGGHQYGGGQPTRRGNRGGGAKTGPGEGEKSSSKERVE